jgi:hypothetical protein
MRLFFLTNTEITFYRSNLNLKNALNFHAKRNFGQEQNKKQATSKKSPVFFCFANLAKGEKNLPSEKAHL